jgi:hypothetical protein
MKDNDDEFPPRRIRNHLDWEGSKCFEFICWEFHAGILHRIAMAIWRPFIIDRSIGWPLPNQEQSTRRCASAERFIGNSSFIVHNFRPLCSWFSIFIAQ